ncbi:MAG: hypothetical protein GY859_31480 [Desulfobacterales bacterium]|nr:hypothetical protein [Desulfobacterales bacterium]
MDRTPNRMTIPFMVAAALFLFSACHSRVEPVAGTLPPSVELKRVLVTPFMDMSSVYGENTTYTCPLCGHTSLIGKVSEDADEYMTRRVYAAMEKRKQFELIPPGRAQGVQSTLLAPDQGQPSELDLAIESGRQLLADAVLMGRLYTFRERLGSGYSAESPASVSFDILLIHVKDGQVLWHGSFEETQQPLSENLYTINNFFKRKARWLTARELADDGLEDVITTFPAP